MLIMCFKFFGINTSADLSLFSPYWLLGIGDGFQSWTNRAAHCVTMLFSCRLGGGGLCQAIIQTADHAPKWVCYAPCTLNTFLLISQKVTAHWSGKKGFTLCPHPTHHAFPMTVTNKCPGCRFLTHFSVYFRYCWTFSRPEYAWNICTWALGSHQSICIGYHN
jgi:hypothetical protein